VRPGYHAGGGLPRRALSLTGGISERVGGGCDGCHRDHFELLHEILSASGRLSGSFARNRATGAPRKTRLHFRRGIPLGEAEKQKPRTRRARSVSRRDQKWSRSNELPCGLQGEAQERRSRFESFCAQAGFDIRVDVIHAVMCNEVELSTKGLSAEESAGARSVASRIAMLFDQLSAEIEQAGELAQLQGCDDDLEFGACVAGIFAGQW
jgi:hypothetical protein